VYVDFDIPDRIPLLSKILSRFFMPDYPSTTRWLAPEERAYAEWRLAQDVAGEEDDRNAVSALQAVKLAFSDWKLYLFLLMHHSNLLSQSFTYVRSA